MDMSVPSGSQVTVGAISAASLTPTRDPGEKCFPTMQTGLPEAAREFVATILLRVLVESSDTYGVGPWVTLCGGARSSGCRVVSGRFRARGADFSRVLFSQSLSTKSSRIIIAESPIAVFIRFDGC